MEFYFRNSLNKFDLHVGTKIQTFKPTVNNQFCLNSKPKIEFSQ